MAIHYGISAYVHYIQWTQVRQTMRSTSNSNICLIFLFVFSFCSKLESRKFPSNLPINVRNVIGFVLSNLERPIRLQAMVLILKQQKIGSIDDGLASLKREVSDHISYSLQSWRKLPHKRNSILRRIQWLQQLYLATLRIQSVNQLGSLDKLVRNILNLWTGNE